MRDAGKAQENRRVSNHDEARRRRGAGPAGPADPLTAFPEAIAQAMRRMAVHERWPDGAAVLRRGERVDSLLLILRGRMRIAMTGSGGEELFIRWSPPGEFIGVVSVMTQRPFPVDAVAHDHCEALRFAWEELRALIETDARAALVLARILGQHAADMTNLLVARTAHTLGDRVLAVLDHLAALNAVPQRDGGCVLALSQLDIAHAVGASRQKVNAALRSLEKAGYIRLGYRSVAMLGRGG